MSTVAQRLRSLAAKLLEEAEALDRADTPRDACDDDEMIETWAAADRFDLPIDTVRSLCRRKGMGEKRGGRWLVSASGLRRYLGET
ncbi:MAG: hypothetical protein M9905_12145 [Rhizobiaceae bacterium]|nr:hypothetical protein [Rhizobiaceae bacterium]